MLELAPYVLLRINFRCVRREMFNLQSPDCVKPAKLLQFPALVYPCAIPKQQHRTTDVHEEVTNEFYGALSADRRGMDLNIQFTCQRESSYDGQVFATDRPRKRRRVTGWSPCLLDGRCHVEGRFIGEDDEAALLFGFLWIIGQVCSSHSEMASSSRSDARTSGFWYDQCKLCIRRRTWPGWYRTPNSSSMTRAIREHVHNSPENPNAFGPRSRSARRRDDCWSERRLPCPIRDLDNSGSFPPSRFILSHWLTAPWVTPSASAIATCVQPWSESSTARSRRHSLTDAVVPFRTPRPPMCRTIPHGRV